LKKYEERRTGLLLIFYFFSEKETSKRNMTVSNNPIKVNNVGIAI